MNKPHTIYFIGGKAFSQESLMQFCHEKLTEKNKSEFEKELFTFILDWFSPSDVIKANTSGSTGKPKEIQLLKKHLMASAKTTISFFDLKQGDKVLLCLPMAFIAGKMMVVRSLVGGLDLYFTEPSSKPELPESCMQFSAMVPLQVSNLLKENAESLLKIEKLIIGGSFISDVMAQQIKNLGTQVWQTYGMTETITHIAVRKLNGPDTSVAYKSLPGSSVSIKNGRIVIHAPHLGISSLETNDLGEMCKNGAFKITGRADNVIVSGGLKFNPEEIENKLSEIISNAYFIGGLDDHEMGQKLVLFIEKGGHIERQIFIIWNKLEERLERFEIPKEIIFLESFTRTASGKTDRHHTISKWKVLAQS